MVEPARPETDAARSSDRVADTSGECVCGDGILTAVFDAVVMTDRQGQIQYLNDSAERLFGWPADAAVGLPIGRLLPDSRFAAAEESCICPCTPCTGLLRSPDGHSLTPCKHRDRRPDANPTQCGGRAELTARRSDGSALPVEVSISGIGLPCNGTGMGEPRCFVIVVRDISARRAVEEALIAARSQAELANRAKSEFLATISHELRTPLNGIIGFAEILRDGMFGPLPKRYAEYAGIIHESGQHLLDIINNLLEMARLNTDRYELMEQEVDSRALIEGCLSLLRARAHEKGIALRLALGACPRLWADRRALMNIVLNLGSNAIKFTEGGGQVTLTSGCDGGGRFFLEVADTGIGIPAEMMPRLFKPFEQGESDMNRRHEGTGLGLAISKNLTELHGGSLDIESEVGVGTRATVHLPATRILCRSERGEHPVASAAA